MSLNEVDPDTKEHFISALDLSSPLAASWLFSIKTASANVFFDQVSRELVLKVPGAVSEDPGFRMPADKVAVSSCASASVIKVEGEGGCRPLPCLSEDFNKILETVYKRFPVPAM